jgi:hypothetical protein
MKPHCLVLNGILRRHRRIFIFNDLVSEHAKTMVNVLRDFQTYRTQQTLNRRQASAQSRSNGNKHTGFVPATG